jgi:high-affinity Fe2+/Pb2+ permease
LAKRRLSRKRRTDPIGIAALVVAGLAGLLVFAGIVLGLPRTGALLALLLLAIVGGLFGLWRIWGR